VCAKRAVRRSRSEGLRPRSRSAIVPPRPKGFRGPNFNGENGERLDIDTQLLHLAFGDAAGRASGLSRKEMTPLLCRAARAFLNWTQNNLGERSGISLDTVKNFETGQRVPLAANRTKIQDALRTAGIRFIEESSQGIGVRMIGATWAAQCRAARCLIGWTHLDVSRASSVSDLTVLRLEAERFTPRRATLIAIRRALEAGGVIFLEDAGEGPGVMVKRPE
jgi:transcriptional regulator with XRE-family HTH domain